jgi:hypothetical protein
MTSSLLIYAADILTVLSNLSLLIPFVICIARQLILRSILFVLECFFSGTYHLCDSFNVCLFPFSAHHFLDFLFAQSLIVQGVVHLVYFTPSTAWLEWVLLIFGILAIAIMQLFLPGELVVQAGVTGFCFAGLLIYWIVYAKTVGGGRIPPYHWDYLLTGISLTAMSIALFAFQDKWPLAYWALHSLWHVAGGVGLAYLLWSKERDWKIMNAASRV